MSDIASCGHEIVNAKAYSWMEYDTDIEEGIVRVVSYGTLCEACHEQYKSWGILLETDREELDWLSGKIEYPQAIP